jgi:hypothetical protein
MDLASFQSTIATQSVLATEAWNPCEYTKLDVYLRVTMDLAKGFLRPLRVKTTTPVEVELAQGLETMQ